MRKINIRSITYSVDLNKIHDQDYVSLIRSNLKGIISEMDQKEIFVRTIRFNVLKQTSKDTSDQFHFIRKVQLLSKVATDLDIRWFNISFDLTNETEKNIKSICNIGYEVLNKFKNSFVNFIVTERNQIDVKAALHSARTVIKVSKLSFNGFDNFRLGVSLNPNEYTPFFPFSYATKDHCFSIATEISHATEEVVIKYHKSSFEELREKLISKVGKQAKDIDVVSKELSTRINASYAGLDISLAPYPDEDVSVINIFKLLGLEEIGANGSLFFTSFMTDLLKEIIHINELKPAGFNGVMYSLLEDPELCKANNKKTLSIDSFILYSSLCGCGLDMVPVPGNILEEELASIILDVSALSIRLNKPLGVRVLPIPNGSSNEYTKFDMDFLTNTRIMDIKNLGCIHKVFETQSYNYLNNERKG